MCQLPRRIVITGQIYSVTLTPLRLNGLRAAAEWGAAGSGSDQFHLPHAIIVDGSNVVYVVDRENERIEKFDLGGHYLGEVDGLGRVYSLALGDHGTLCDDVAAQCSTRVARLDREDGTWLWQDIGLCACDRYSDSSLPGSGEWQPATDGCRQ
jgi:hypothetical protein